MSLEKAIEHGKETRKDYFGSKRFDKTCRCHGSCPWCQRNRKHNEKKREVAFKQRLEEVIDFYDEDNVLNTDVLFNNEYNND